MQRVRQGCLLPAVCQGLLSRTGLLREAALLREGLLRAGVLREGHLRQVLQVLPAYPGTRPVRGHEGVVRVQGHDLRDFGLLPRQGMLPGTLRESLLRACAKACCEPNCCEKVKRCCKVRCCEKACCAPECCEKPRCCKPACCEPTCEPKCHKLYRRPLVELLEDLFGERCCCGKASCEAGCCEAACGCGGSAPMTPKPTTAPGKVQEKPAPLPPAPKADPSAAVPGRGIYQASRDLVRN